MIYFIQSDSGSIKIGYTENPIDSRMRALQTGSSEQLSLLAVMPGDKKIEKTLHDKFSSTRLRGEWFNSSAKLIKFIEKNASKSTEQSEKKAPDVGEIKIGNSIKSLRLSRNIDRKTLCGLAGVSMNALRHLEGGTGATIRTLVLVLRALNKEYWLDSLAPYVSINPLHMVNGKPRQRARVSNK